MMELLDGRYQIKRILGKGGFGTTFLAEDMQSSTLSTLELDMARQPHHPSRSMCVVKKLQPDFSELYLLKKAKDLFNREAETLGILGKHPNIPTLFAYFEENHEFHIVQEYIAGHTLEQELLLNHSLSEQQVINILREVLKILKFVHRHNVIHRDIKPANLIRRKRDNKLVLIDFGSVKKVTKSTKRKGTIVGSYGYISEEQFNGKPNFSSDLYALGMIGIQAITGIEFKQILGAGFSLNQQGEINWQKYAKVSNKLANFLSIMVRNNYRQRYQSAKEALQALQEITETKQFMAATPQKKSNNKAVIPSKKLILGSIFIGLIGTICIAYSLLIRQKSYLRLPLTGKLTKRVLSEKDDCQDLAAHFHCEKYFFSGKKGQKIIIEMSSDNFNPYLALLKNDNSQLAVNDDISMYNRNAQIMVDLPQDGKYIIIARNAEVGVLGKYSIRALTLMQPFSSTKVKK